MFFGHGDQFGDFRLLSVCLSDCGFCLVTPFNNMLEWMTCDLSKCHSSILGELFFYFSSFLGFSYFLSKAFLIFQLQELTFMCFTSVGGVLAP